MTRNNLNEHLGWLLNNKTPWQPAAPQLPAAPEPPDSLSASATSVSFSAASATSDGSSQPRRVPPLSDPNSTFISTSTSTSTSASAFSSTSTSIANSKSTSRPPPLPATTTPRPPTLPNATRPPAHSRNANKLLVMERLMDQLPSSASNQPTLKTKQQPLPTPAPTTRTAPIGPLQRAYSASLAREPPSTTIQPPKKSPSPVPARSDFWKTRPAARSFGIADIDDDMFSDPLDLTEADDHDGSSSVVAFGEEKRLWREDFAERPEPVSSRPRRAGIEGAPQRSHPTKERLGHDEDEFPDIDDLIPPSSVLRSVAKQRAKSVIARAESPCSQLTTGLASLGNDTFAMGSISSSTGGDGEVEKGTYNEGELGLPRAHVENTPSPPARADDFATSSRKRKTPSSPTPADETLPRAEFTPFTQPSQKSKRTRRHIVLDSEDDLMGSSTHDAGLGIRQPAAEDQLMDCETSPPRPGTSFSVSPPSVNPSTTSSAKKNTAVLTSDTAEEARSDDALSLRDTQHKQDSQASRDSDVERNKHILGLFLNRPSVVESKAISLNDQLRRNKEDFTQCLRNNAPKEERERVRNARNALVQKQKALDAVKAEQETLKDLSSRREDLLTELGNAFADGLDTAEDEAKLDELSEQISAKEAVLVRHLVAAGIDDLDFLKDPNDSIAAPDSPATPVVFATQPSGRYGIKAASKENAAIPEYHSQVVLQTQSSQNHTQVTASTTLVNTSRLPSTVGFSQIRSGARPRNSYLGNTDKNRACIEIVDDDDFEIDPDEGRMELDPSFPVPPQPLPARSQAMTPGQATETPGSDSFDHSSDEEAMLDAAESFEQQQLMVTSSSAAARARSVLSESSGNAGGPLRKRAAAKNVPAQVPKASINPELMKFPWSGDVRRALKDRFRMTDFRQNQLEAINATLAGKDAFVLMPTGGGKSLCYQLPAVVNSGKTRGLTLVISPLLSLMNDQVAHMKRLNILATSFNGTIKSDLRNHILGVFHQANPEHFIQLLYVTPEMLVNSPAFKKGIEVLHRKQKLARIVIDEAHCVSHWGHDFRPDYKALGLFRRGFPGVPVMALTATATQNVIADIKHNLDIGQCETFSQSFNRPNLYYEVIEKKARFIRGMGELITTKYPGQTGIVYTLSRKSAEGTANALQTKHGIEARYYHAQMDPDAKIEVQEKWQKGEVHVVVATIAFGMGIDNPNVRFVIHQNMPKSLEGYYQETGRAGRDGQPSDCYLYFSYQDIPTLRRMINEDRDKLPDEKERQHAMINRMVAYCESSHACRRVQILQYFGEKFDAAQCGDKCDNCSKGRTNNAVLLEDYTECAVAFLKAVSAVGEVTLGRLVEIITASKNVGRHNSIPGFAVCRGMAKHEAQRVVMALHAEGALVDSQKLCLSNSIPITNYKLGEAAAKYLDGTGEHRLRLEVLRAGSEPPQPKKKNRRAANLDETASNPSKTARSRRPPPSTNVSSPVASLSKKRKTKSPSTTEPDGQDEGDEGDDGPELHANGYERDDFVVSDKEDEADAFEPRRPQPQPRQQTLDELAPPISRDRRLDEAGLDEVHQDIVQAFVERAQRVEETLRNKHGLRRPLFTEQQYREMAIRWTTTVAQMYTIRGVDKTKVDSHGAKFASLVQQFHDRYEEMMGRTAPSFSPVEMATARRKKREVVDLISDDEEAAVGNRRGFQFGGAEDEEDGDDGGEDYDEAAYEEEEEEEDLESSHYFAGGGGRAPSPDPVDNAAVEEWHKQFDVLRNANAHSGDGGSRSSGGSWRGGKKSYSGRGRGGWAGSSRGGRGGGRRSFSRASSTSGVSKRRGSVSRQFGRGGTSAASGRGKSTAASKRSGDAGGDIPSMPY